MVFHYPNGKKYQGTPNVKNINKQLSKQSSYSNRGMTLEEDLNETNLYYRTHNIAVVHKKPIPVQIVNVDYPSRSAAVIKEAYFRQASTTDYNGVWNGKYIDFEAKETKSNSSFPLRNFHEHQIEHMKSVVQQEGITFVIIRFVTTDEIFLLEGKVLFFYWERMVKGGRKSIKKDEIIKDGIKIPYGLHPRIDYIKTVQKLNLL
ncbi:Holliday junction resolvase RecU [Lederbergia galactosidilytica]|uniref:Holliday junction resolvase RecU n=1 Tax=Lederbergia galactosidilytica TaxID=217031 RepID=A0A0Q9YHM7_9BACI|nr:Holliday junction resolvase RecU [Lederbergia galactosidilytica]KRG16263.1 Holliday junction resolvase [Lederbergia galactosidilytica]OAK69833.1 Holliday junction resolvase [Lederbergia galactosidilytica]